MLVMMALVLEVNINATGTSSSWFQLTLNVQISRFYLAMVISNLLG